MKLPLAPADYSQSDQSRTRSLLEQADTQNLKRGHDIELGPGVRLIMRDATGARVEIVVDAVGDVYGIPL